MWDDYIFVLSPNKTGIERPQMKYIKPFVNPVNPPKYEINKYTLAGEKRMNMYNAEKGFLNMFDVSEHRNLFEMILTIMFIRQSTGEMSELS